MRRQGTCAVYLASASDVPQSVAIVDICGGDVETAQCRCLCICEATHSQPSTDINQTTSWPESIPPPSDCIEPVALGHISAHIGAIVSLRGAWEVHVERFIVKS